jgi:hypothetical protein
VQEEHLVNQSENADQISEGVNQEQTENQIEDNDHEEHEDQNTGEEGPNSDTGDQLINENEDVDSLLQSSTSTNDISENNNGKRNRDATSDDSSNIPKWLKISPGINSFEET